MQSEANTLVVGSRPKEYAGDGQVGVDYAVSRGSELCYSRESRLLRFISLHYFPLFRPLASTERAPTLLDEPDSRVNAHGFSWLEGHPRMLTQRHPMCIPRYPPPAFKQPETDLNLQLAP